MKAGSWEAGYEDAKIFEMWLVFNKTTLEALHPYCWKHKRLLPMEIAN